MDDLYDVFEYSSSLKVGPMAGWLPHKTIEDTYLVLQTFIKQREMYAIVYKKTKKVIGSIGVHKDIKRDDPTVKMIGYVLNEKYWGQGIMVEVVKRMINQVFTYTNTSLITIYHFPFNKQSKRVIEKCGFKFEGILRQGTVMQNGTVYDDYCYSLSKKEFLNSLSNL